MRLILCLLAFCCLMPAASAREYKLYAALLAETPVELADGSKWVMDKGDVFPVLMFKEMRTKIVLQLDGTNFRIETKTTRILKKEEIAAGLINYEKNVGNYARSKKPQTQ